MRWWQVYYNSSFDGSALRSTVVAEAESAFPAYSPGLDLCTKCGVFYTRLAGLKMTLAQQNPRLNNGRSTAIAVPHKQQWPEGGVTEEGAMLPTLHI